MALYIIDRVHEKLIKKANFWDIIDQNNKQEKLSKFEGISFVSSISFIEENLLPRFSDITLILGLSDNGKDSIGKQIRQLMTERVKMAEFSNDHPDSEFTKRILDGTLKLRFTKKNLIHSKLYLLSNENKYAAFSGSMNLTQMAVSSNIEQLSYDYGIKASPIFNVYHELYQEIYHQSSVYMDAKKLKGLLRAQNKEQLQINVYTDSTEMIKNADAPGEDVVVLPAEQIKKYRDQYDTDEELNRLSEDQKITVAQTVSLFGDAGNKRRKLDNIGHKLYTLTQNLKYVESKQKGDDKINNAIDVYPKPVAFYNQNQLFESPKIGDNVRSDAITSDLSQDELRDALQLFCDIAHEYDKYKQVGEGWQACDFMFFLYQSPWLWKVRNMYELSNTSHSREDVPLGITLIGQGRTGKSTLGKRLAAKLTGAHNFLDSGMLDKKNYALANRNINMTINDVINSYFYTGAVSPLMIDDVSPDLTTRNYFEATIKELSNNRNLTKPMPTMIFTMNRKESDTKSQFSLKPEIMRRLWYLSFESTFSGDSFEREKALMSLFNRADDKLYRYCQVELAKFFENVSDETEAKIEEDYLYPIKHILKIALEQFDMYDQVREYFKDNYDYSLFVGRNDWTMLINQASIGSDMMFIKQDGRLKAQFNKELFTKSSDKTRSNNGSIMMNRYYQYLPRKYHISYQLTNTGFIVDVENFDKWLDSDTLYQKYKSSDGVQQQDLNESLKKTMDAVAKTQEMLAEQQTKNSKKKHGLFHWFRRE